MAMKKYINIFLLVVFTISCKEEEPLDPCRYITVNIVLTNKTKMDIGFMIVLQGCFSEGYLSNEHEDGISAAANQTNNKEMGWVGLDYIVFVRFIDNKPIIMGGHKIEEEGQTITAIVTYDGTDYKMEFI